MNVISFSLYGQNSQPPAPKYLIGLQRNIELAREFYPGWQVVIFHDGTVTNLPGCHHCLGEPKMPPMLWRYCMTEHPGVKRMIVRDADSRISQREAEAVNAWIESDKIFHILRDHPAHRLCPGGLIGIQPRRDNWEMPSMLNTVGLWMIGYRAQGKDPFAYSADQDFLEQVIWPMFKGSCLQHDSVAGRRQQLGALPFPSPRKDWPRFCGEVVAVDGEGKEFYRPFDYENCPKE